MRSRCRETASTSRVESGKFVSLYGLQGWHRRTNDTHTSALFLAGRALDQAHKREEGNYHAHFAKLPEKRIGEVQVFTYI